MPFSGSQRTAYTLLGIYGKPQSFSAKALAVTNFWIAKGDRSTTWVSKSARSTTFVAKGNRSTTWVDQLEQTASED